jgi:hypothetical protein
MTFKLPEPEGKIAYDGLQWEEDWISSQPAYSEEQLIQVRHDALEDAEDLICEKIGRSGAWLTRAEAAEAVRKLKDET